MSHIKLKTKYNTEGNYGSIDENIVYAHHNNCTDYVTFYDKDGDVIMIVPDTIDNNLLDAINKLYTPFKESTNDLKESIEVMNENDLKICNLK